MSNREGGESAPTSGSTGWQPIETAPKDRPILVTCWYRWASANGMTGWANTPIYRTTFDSVRGGFDTYPQRQPTHWINDPPCPHADLLHDSPSAVVDEQYFGKEVDWGPPQGREVW